MKKETTVSALICLFGPVFRYIVVNEIVADAADYLWILYLQEKLQGAGTAYSQTVLTVWSLLRLFLPVAAGCLSVRREARLEEAVFAAAHRQRQGYLQRGEAGEKEQSGQTWPWGEEVQSGRPGRSGVWDLLYEAGGDRVRARVISVLLPSVAFLALGINVLFSCFMPGTEMQRPAGTLPGMSGILLQAVFYCFFIPFAEETVFRGIFYPRLKRWYGTGMAVWASGAFFGFFHGARAQGIYAFLMGILFAASYEVFGCLAVPAALHGVCNLAILSLWWTGYYSLVRTPVWAAVFLGIAAGGFVTINRILHKDRYRRM